MTVETFLESASALGIKLIIAIVCLLIAFAVINKISSGLEKLAGKSGRLDKTITHTLGYVASIALKVLVVLSLIGYLGINTAGIATIIASLGVGVGMAVNGAVANFAGGLIILVTRPFRVDDFVEVAGTMGTVEEIRLVHTKIRTLDNKVVYVPNGTASGATVINYSEKELRRVDQVYSIAYENDFEKAKSIIEGLIAAHPKALADPAPFVRVSAHADHAIEITVRVWCKAADYWDVHFDLMEQVKKAFDQNAISIPYPQMDVHMK